MANAGRSGFSPKPTLCGATRKNPTSAGARLSAKSEPGAPRYLKRLCRYLLQLLQTAADFQLRRHRRIRKAGLPVGDADFADINIAFRIHCDAVRREEFAGFQPRAVLAAEPGDAVALGVDDREPWAEIGHLAIDRQAGTEFADDEIRLFAAAAAQRAGPVQIVPLRLVFAVAVEHLHAVVLAIRDIDPAVGVGCDVVDDIELAGIGARLAPGFQELAIGRI